MEYLTLKEIKKQLNVDEQFKEDDEFLELLGESAEDMCAQLLDCSLDQLVAENGDIPASVRHALRMLVDYMYSQNRGSSGESIDIPNAIYTILKLYRNFR
jgi:hypothetical protein